MYEVVFDLQHHEDRGVLHKTREDAAEYARNNASEGEGWEIWQVADDTNRTRVKLVGQVI